jgi:hypothetical protein
VGQRPGVGVGGGQQLVRRQHPVDETHRRRLLGQHHPRRQQQVGRVAQADEPGEHPRQAELGRQPQPGGGGGELGPGGGEAQVAEAGQHEAHPGGRAVDGGDDRGGHAVVEREGVVELGPHPVARRGRRLAQAVVVAAGLDVALERAEIGAGAETPARPRDHHDPHRRVGLGLGQAPAVLGVHAAGPGVEPVGPVEGDGGDPLGHLVAHGVQVHGPSLARPGGRGRPPDPVAAPRWVS